LFAAAVAEKDDYLSADAVEDDYLAERPNGISDPLEGLNRGIFWVNRGVDTVVLRPVAKAYEFAVPEFGRRRVSNFIHNLGGPLVTLNSLLQGDSQNMFVSFWRFVFNSTLGVAGLFDIASELGVPQQHDEDFGQTLGAWGMASGPYLVLPILGPSSLRDVVGLGVDMVADPFTYAPKSHERYKILGVRVVDTRARFGKLIDDTYESALDPYAAFRSLYLQHREAQVANSANEPAEMQKVK
jgi:phospholipid-binding lipoprotein MlaA